MLKIAVCDDAGEERALVAEYTARFFGERQMAVHIDTYEKGEGILEADRNYDLYLLDVLMPGMSGIETAARLGNGNHAVIFITSSLEAAVDGYSVNAAGFILKPVEKASFEATMERVAARRLNALGDCIAVIHNRVLLNLKLEQIAWFENRLHRVFVTLTGGEALSINQKLPRLSEELLTYPQFLRCHQSYLVNLEQVAELEDSCFHMKDGHIIPISRNFYKQSKHAYFHHRLS